HLDRVETSLMALARHELGENARFVGGDSFILWASPDRASHVPLGRYELPRRNPDAYIFRLGHPLADFLIAQAKNRSLSTAHIVFDYTAYERKISSIERLVGTSGWMSVSLLTLDGSEVTEDHVAVAAIRDDLQPVPAEDAMRFFTLPGYIGEDAPSPSSFISDLRIQAESVTNDIVAGAVERNAEYLEVESEKLDKWADDLRQSLRGELRSLEELIGETRRQIKITGLASERNAVRRRINQLEAELDEKRNELSRRSQEITRRRDDFYDDVDRRLRQESTIHPLFTIRWSVI
ncbi:MAG TPA: hypothetical protein VFQ54_11265, partial [Thermomicrobiales bacterium]|nr:hypothetical protein [Thermomicrobiales bacterium]